MVRLSFCGGSFTGPDVLEANVMEQLAAAERRLGVVPEYLTAAGRFAFLLEALQEWYNGYSWRGADKVYNPYDVLLLLRRHEFEAHWFETGTPAFLVDKLFERRLSTVSVGDMVSTGELLSAFDVHHIGTEALLFQTGYLTITGEERLGGKVLYRLGYPNREVRQSLNDHLLRHLVQDSDRQTANSIRLARLLEAHDCTGLKDLFHAFFASIPYQCNHIADYEGFSASVFYSYFAALGYDVAVEESSSHGRLDMAVRAAGEPIHLIGVEFSRATRNITAFEVADA